jgi:3-carboxy-cis,cis-muconate cycloisomerase
MSDILDPLFGTDRLRPVFTDDARLQAMLDVEAALAAALAKAGVIPKAAVKPIATQCRADRLDLETLKRDATSAGNLAIPLVRQLTGLVRAANPNAARYVHWGATSQDIIDTGLVLQLRAAVAIVEADLARLDRALMALARNHRDTVMVGRTWLQQALPITFGLKAAGWLDALRRHRQRLAEIKPRLLVLQFGGAAGTLASLGDKGLAVAQALADRLGLGLPTMPWHAQRDRLVEFASGLGNLAGSLGKIARDVSLMMQSEIGEAFEAAGEGKGGSSTMPHKRNPVSCAAILANAARTPGLVATLMAAQAQEHERGLGGWQAEWLALPDLVMASGGALGLSVGLIEGLAVDAQRMHANLELTKGLVMAEALSMALAQKLGKEQAHRLVETLSRRAARHRRHLRAVAAADPTVAAHLKPAELARLFDPARYTGVAGAFVDRVIRRAAIRRPGSPRPPRRS